VHPPVVFAPGQIFVDDVPNEIGWNGILGRRSYGYSLSCFIIVSRICRAARAYPRDGFGLPDQRQNLKQPGPWSAR